MHLITWEMPGHRSLRVTKHPMCHGSCFHLNGNTRRKIQELASSSALEPKLLKDANSFIPLFRPSISTLGFPVQLCGQGEPPPCSRDTLYLPHGPHQCQGTCLCFEEALSSCASPSLEGLCLRPTAHVPLHLSFPRRPLPERVGQVRPVLEVPPGDSQSS